MITVVMSCYFPDGEVGEARQGYAKQVVDSLQHHLLVQEEVTFLYAVDHEQNDLAIDFWSYADNHLGNRSGMTFGPNNGIGASLNRALTHIQGDIWMYITDDWVLNRNLNISKSAQLMRDLDYGYFRLGPLHPHLSCVTMFNIHYGWWLGLYYDILGGFVFATRPFLMTKACYERKGPFKEGVNSYDCEIDYNDRMSQGPYIERTGSLLSDATEWEHIGEVEVGYLAISH